MARVQDEEWGKLWAGILDLSQYFPDGIVFIGGVAVLLHVRNGKLPEGFVEYSHDGDFFLSLADFADLRDLEEVTANRRLNKHQIVKNGIEFDIYLENHNGLIVKYADVMAESAIIDGVRVASLEHLLLLKLDAYASRRGSAKGSKDERDLVKICYLLAGQGTRHDRLSGYLVDEAVTLLVGVKKSSEFMTICAGNVHDARGVRAMVTRAVESIESRYTRGRSK